MHKDLLQNSCNITLVLVLCLCYNMGIVEEVSQYATPPEIRKEVSVCHYNTKPI